MRKLIALNQVTVDGYFTSMKGDGCHTHIDKEDGEWPAFIAESTGRVGTLLLGRVTYEVLARYCSAPRVTMADPVLAERISTMPKIVFSRTLETASWNNSKLIKSGLLSEVRKLKKTDDDPMAIIGSGSIVSQLAQEGLIDEFIMMVNAVFPGNGRTIFDGIKQKFNLRLLTAAPLSNGKVLLSYEPVL